MGTPMESGTSGRRVSGGARVAAVSSADSFADMSELPRTIGRYQILRELGRGMMGVVYLAHDPGLGRDVALKVVQYPAGAKESDRRSYEERFFAEGRSAARLSHPAIVVVHDVGRDDASGAPFMALQFVPGQ